MTDKRLALYSAAFQGTLRDCPIRGWHLGGDWAQYVEECLARVGLTADGYAISDLKNWPDSLTLAMLSNMALEAPVSMDKEGLMVIWHLPDGSAVGRHDSSALLAMLDCLAKSSSI
jgi:hypothetical protein